MKLVRGRSANQERLTLENMHMAEGKRPEFAGVVAVDECRCCCIQNCRSQCPNEIQKVPTEGKTFQKLFNNFIYKKGVSKDMQASFIQILLVFLVAFCCCD